jgi:hypothetical protein
MDELDAERLRRLGYAYYLQGFDKPEEGLKKARFYQLLYDRPSFQIVCEGFAQAKADESKLKIQSSQAKGTDRDLRAAATSARDTIISTEPKIQLTQKAQTESGPEKEPKMMAFKIETGVAIPPKRRASSPSEPKYPFGDMNPGQSFTVVGEKERNNALNAMSKFMKDHPGIRFVSRTVAKVDEQGYFEDSQTGDVVEVGGEYAGQPVVRIWRTGQLNGGL